MFVVQRYTIFRILILIFGCCFVLQNGLANENVIDTNETPNGQLEINLSSVTHIRINNTASALVLFFVDQKKADARVLLKHCSMGSKYAATTVNFPGTYRQPEIFATFPDTQTCEITVSANEQSDRYADTLLTWQTISVPSQSLITAVAWLVKGGEYWAQYFADKSSNKQDDLQAAVDSFALAEDLLAPLNSPLLQTVQYKQAEAYHYLGRYEKQANTLLTLLKYPGVKTNLRVQAHIDLASHAIYETRDFKKAKQHLASAFKILGHDNHTIQFADALETKVAIEIEQANFDSGIHIFSSTYSIFLEQGATRAAINSALSLGYFYFRAGQVLRASQEYNSAKLLAESIGDSFSITNANIKLATVYRKLGNFEKAAEYVDLALAVTSLFKHSYLDAYAKLEKAKLLKATLQYHYAMDWFEDAKKAFKRINATADAYQVDVLLASMYVDLRRYEKAEKLLLDYLAYALVEQTPLEIAHAEMQIADLKLKKGLIKDAIHFQQRALAYFENASDAFALADVQFSLAASLSVAGQFKKAKVLFNNAFSFYKSIDATPAAFSAIYNYAKYFSAEASDKSLLAIDKALNEGLLQHAQTKREDLSIGFSASLQDLVNLKVTLDTSLSEEDGLLLVENIKARALKRFVDYKARSTSKTDEHEVQLNDINLRMSKKLVEMQSATGVSKQAIAKHIRTLSEERYKIEKSIYFSEDITPEHQEFNQKDLKDLQAKLSRNELVLFIDSGENTTHLWFISEASINQYAITDSFVLEEQVTTLLSNFKNKMSLRENRKLIRNITARIFPAPLEFENKQDLIVIADGPLASLPFSVLENPLSKESLIKSMSFSFHQSLALLLEQKSRLFTKSASTNALIIASPEMKVKKRVDQGFNASYLPFSNAEAQFIEEAIDDSITSLIGKSASKQNLLQQPLNQFGIIHFASHAVANSDFPEIGGLVLSNHTSSDNLLLAPEIKNLNLNADLVVLSGCDTSQGKLIAGEGMLGLSRAFMQAGARNVIGSLWKVQDDVTAKLMQSFYTYHFEQNMSVRSALVNAQKDIRSFKRKDGRKPWRAPYYWAGFILHGTGS
ncbi:MAG: CHAT domain-containing protein [Alteromonadaceae bacterium]|nr:CHAT domain-containing protein [Alteromonadaceae bacterium]